MVLGIIFASHFAYCIARRECARAPRIPASPSLTHALLAIAFHSHTLLRTENGRRCEGKRAAHVQLGVCAVWPPDAPVLRASLLRGAGAAPRSLLLPFFASRPARLLARNAGRQDLQDQVRAVPHGEPRRGPQAGPQPVRAAAAAAPPRRRYASARESSHSRGLRAAAATPLLPPLLALRRHGLIGRTSGTTPGFAYSAANKAAGIVWSEEHLFDYLLGACGSEPSPRASARARARHHPPALALALFCRAQTPESTSRGRR